MSRTNGIAPFADWLASTAAMLKPYRACSGFIVPWQAEILAKWRAGLL